MSLKPAEAVVLTSVRAAAARARRVVRFGMTAGSVLVTLAVRLSSPPGCASGHAAEQYSWTGVVWRPDWAEDLL